MSTQELDVQTKARVEARKVLAEAVDRAQKAYEEAKKQADMVHRGASRLALYTQAKEESDKAYKEAVKQAGKLRDAITLQAQAVFTAVWGLSKEDYAKAVDRAQKAWKEAKRQADMVYKEAKKLAIYEPDKTTADRSHDEAIKQAEKDHKEAMIKLTFAEKSPQTGQAEKADCRASQYSSQNDARVE